MASVIRPREIRIAQDHPASRRHAVGDVVESLRIEVVEVAEDAVFEQLGVQRGDAVDRVAADARQVRHADGLLAPLVDQRHPRHPLVVVRIANPDLVEEPAIDFEDDLEMPRQKRAEQRQRPLFERFGQQRVVRVRERLPRHVPRRVPVHQVLVDEEPHQLGHRDRRVRVVELRHEMLVEPLERIADAQVQPQHVLQRARHEEILLLQPELLALRAAGRSDRAPSSGSRTPPSPGPRRSSRRG